MLFAFILYLVIVVLVCIWLDVITFDEPEKYTDDNWILLKVVNSTHTIKVDDREEVVLREPISYWIYGRDFKIKVNDAVITGTLPDQLASASDDEVVKFLVDNYTPWAAEWE